jgi:photosystem II stability/assembly factor-like uncharacterized protein
MINDYNMKNNTRKHLILFLLVFMPLQVFCTNKINDMQMVDATHGWAVGDNGIIMKWNGITWTKEILPFYTESNLTHVRFINNSFGYVAGEGGTLLFYNGTKWIATDIFTSNIATLSVINTTSLWIGDSNNLNFLTNLVPDDNYLMENAPDTNLCSYFTDATHGWLSMYNKTIYYYNGSTWSVSTTAPNKIVAMHFIDNNRGWAVGNNGTILKYSFGSWSNESVSAENNLSKVFMNSNTLGWASSINGSIFKFDGSTWTKQQLPGSTDNVTAIAFSSASNGWAIDASNKLYYYDGTSWVLNSTLNISSNTFPSGVSAKLSGVIKTYTNWSVDTVNIISTLTIPASAKRLTIQSGTIIRNGKLNSFVPLTIKGIAGDSVKFIDFSILNIRTKKIDTSYLSFTSFAANGAFISSYDNSYVIENSVFKNAGTINISNGNYIKIQNCEFSKINSVSLSNNVKINIANSIIKNILYTGLNITGGEIVDIKGTTISYCSATGILATSTNFFLSNSKLHNNKGVNGGALWLRDSKVNIDNCLITNNETVKNLSYAVFGGGAIYASQCKLSIANSTIAYNKTDSLGGGIYSNYSDGSLYNCILWGNMAKTDTNQYHLLSTNSSLNFYNCNVHYDQADFSKGANAIYSGVYKNNISAIPQFTTSNITTGSLYNGLLANWKLKTTSPCINKGIVPTGNIAVPETDLAGEKRIYNQFIDQGPYETHLTKTTVCGLLTGNTTWAADTVIINCTVTIPINTRLTIIPGTTVIFNSNAQINIEGSLLAQGTTTAPIKFVSLNNFDKGIWLNNLNNLFDNNDSTIFRFCKFENITGDIYFYRFKKIAVENCEFTKCKSYNSMQIGIFNFWYCTFSFTNNSFTNCTRTPLFSNGSEVAIRHNRFISNSGAYLIYLANCDGDFRNNFIQKSHTYYSTLLVNACNVDFYNNLIVNNSIDATFFSKAAVSFNGTSNTFANNTVAYNDSLGLFSTNGTIKLINNIFIKNKVNLDVPSILSDWFVSNNYIETPYYASAINIQNPITLAPLFVKSADSIGAYSKALLTDFKQLSISKGINTGLLQSDIYNIGNVDVDKKNRFNGVIDIGAYENSSTTPTFKSQPAGQTVCIGTTVVLSVLVSDTVFYQWQKDGVNIPNANNSSYKITNAQENASGSYACVISNSFGTLSSNIALLQVQSPPTFATNPQNKWIDRFAPYKLEAIVNGRNVSYKWKHNNILLPDTSNSLTFSSFNYEKEGKYICEISNNCGSAVSNNIKLYVSPKLINQSKDLLCEGDTFKLKIVFHDSATFKWIKDGAEIVNASDSIFVINKLTENNQGNYACRISNSYNSGLSEAFLLQIKKSPEITDLSSGNLVASGAIQNIEVRADGLKPIHYQWFKDGVKLSTDTLPKYKITSFSKSDEANYSCNVTNVCGTAKSSNIILSLAPQICMVTVDSASGKNLVVWDKVSKIKYKKFNIYREGTVTGFYNYLGSVPYDSIGVFTDKLVNPKSQAYLYKITATDLNNVETDINLSNLHKTIHLLVTKGTQGGVQLDWDEYFGFPYSTYFIYRSKNNGKFSVVHEMASSTRTWTDFETVSDNDTLFYLVAVNKANGCYPASSLLKAGNDGYSQSLSNIEDNRSRLRAISTSTNNITSNSNFSFYPNPVNELATLSYTINKSSQVNILLYDISGRIAVELFNGFSLAGKHTLEINAQKLSKGIYTLQFSTNGSIELQKLVVK